MITQSRLFSYIDIYFGLAVLGVVALVSIAIARIRPRTGPHHFYRGKRPPELPATSYVYFESDFNTRERRWPFLWQVDRSEYTSLNRRAVPAECNAW